MTDNNLSGRNLAKEAYGSDMRKKTFIQKYIFDMYNHQQHFMVSTNEVFEKLLDALWPFNPET